MLGEVYYRITGPEQASKRWVFLHGLMGYSANWRKIASKFEETDQVLVFDQRGHGRSFQPESGYEPEDYANDLKAILDELEWKNVILVGHSMGGRNALNFGFRFPEYLSHLVIEDIGPELNSDGSKFEKLFEVIPTPFPNKSDAKDYLLNEFPKKMPGVWQNPQAIAQYLYANIEQNEDGRADWRFSPKGILESVRAGRSKDRWAEVKGLKVPTLWIRGGDSDELSKETFQEVLTANPEIQGVEIGNAGHWVHADQPEEFVKVLRDFASAT